MIFIMKIKKIILYTAASLILLFPFRLSVSAQPDQCPTVSTLSQYAACCDGSSSDSSSCTTFANQYGGAGTTTNSCSSVTSLAQYSKCCAANINDGSSCAAFAVQLAAQTKKTDNNAPAAPAANQPLNIHLNNPLSVSTIGDAINLFLSVIIRVALPLIILFFIWSGLSFIFARGNPEKVKVAKNMFFYTVIGTLLILGAWVITNAIIGTVNSIIG